MTDLSKLKKLAQQIAENASVLTGGNTDDETLEANILEIQEDAEKIVAQVDGLILAELLAAGV